MLISGRRFLLIGLLLIMVLGVTGRLVYSVEQAVTLTYLPPQSPAGNSVSVIGHLGGPVQAVQATATTIFAAVGPELASFSVVSPNMPVRQDYQLYGENITDLTIAGDYAYLANGDFHILDISDPNDLRPQSSAALPGTTLNVAVSGTNAYVVGSNFGAPFGQLRIIDVMTPTNPVELSDLTYPTEARAVAITSTYAVVANDTSGLQIVDINDPANPQTVRTQATIGQAYDILIRGNYGFVATVSCAVNCTGGVQIFQLADPADPGHVDFIPLPIQPAQLALQDNLLLVANGAGGLAIIDITAPESAVNLGLTNLPENAFAVTSIGNDAYVATGRGGLQHVELSPTNHTGGTSSFNNAYSTLFADDYAFIGDGEGLQVVDTTDPTNPELMAQMVTPAGIYAMTLASDYLFLAEQLAGLEIYDVSNPLNPQFVAPFNTPGSVNAVLVDGDYAYLADGSTGLRVLNINDIANPVEVANIDTAGIAWDLYRIGNLLYVADFDRGIRIFDITDPTIPQEIGLYNTPGEAVGIVVSGDLAFVADGVEGVRVVDVSNPQNPFEIGSFDNQRFTYDLQVVGGYVYAANDTGGLLTLDVTEPTAPFQISRRNTAGQAWGVAVDLERGLIGLADRFGGYYIFQQETVALGGNIHQANGQGFGPVTVESNASGSVLSDGSGRFDYPMVTLGQQILTPNLTGYAFWPPTQTVNLPPAQTNVRFTILPEAVQTSVNSGASSSLSYQATNGVTTTLTIPAAAVDDPVTLVLTPTIVAPAIGFSFAAHAFELAAYQSGLLQPDFVFNLPISVTLDYSDDDLGNINDEFSLDLYLFNNFTWQPSGNSCSPSIPGQLNLAQNRLTTALCETGTFALFGNPQQHFLPIVSRP